MSQTLQNQMLIAKSMLGIIELSDGAGTTISNGNIICDDLTGNNLNVTNVDTTNMTLQNLNMSGSFEVPDVNDITTTYGLVSFANYGNSYLAKNLYIDGYLLPYFPLSTTSYRLGLSAMQYLLSTSLNNMAWGTNALQGATSPATGYSNLVQRTIAIGTNALNLPVGIQDASTLPCQDNVIIGYNAMKSAFYNIKDMVVIGSNCIAGNGTGSNNSVVIGANIGSGANNSNYENCVVVGSNNCTNVGVNSAVVVGANNLINATFPDGYANNAVILGTSNLINSISFDQVITVGNNCFNYLNNGASSIAMGYNVMPGLTNGYFVICIGSDSNTNYPGLTNATCVGMNTAMTTNDSNTFMIGGNDAGFQNGSYPLYQNLCIKNKNRVLTGRTFTSASAVLAFENAEHIFITTATTTSITLPTPSTNGNTNIGARFKIMRTYTGTWNNITINAPSGQTIAFNNSSSSTYTFASSETYVQFVCTATTGSTWTVSASQQIATGGFSTGLSTNTINPYITANQCDLWTSSTASTINIGNQSTAQIINFSKINTNSIEPKTTGGDINLFTTTIASRLNLGNSGNIINAYFYLNPTISGLTTFTGGITASATQTINFGANAPTMRGDNIVANSIGQTQVNNGYMDLWTNQTILLGGIKTFTSPPVMSGASITAGTIGQTQISNGYLDLSSDQTITSGIKTFNTAPVMSGASITATSIPNSALQTTVTLNNTASTFSALKSFTVAPVMSGGSITTTSIPNSALQTTVTLNNSTSTFSATKTFSAGINATGPQTINFGTNTPTMVGTNVTSIPLNNILGYATLSTYQNTTSYFPTMTSFASNPIIAHTYDPLFTNNSTSTNIIVSGSTYFYSVYLTAGLVIQKCSIYMAQAGTTQTIQSSLYNYLGQLIISFGTTGVSSIQYSTMTAASAVTISTDGFYWIAMRSIHSGAVLPIFSAMVPPTPAPSLNFKTSFNNVSNIAPYRACSIQFSFPLTNNIPAAQLVLPENRIVYMALSLT